MNHPPQALKTSRELPLPALTEIVAPASGSRQETPRNKGSARESRSILKASTGSNGGSTWQTTPGLLDDEYHEQLSDRLGIHRATPAWDVPCTEADMRLWLKEAGITPAHYLRVTALRSLEDFIELNPRWSLRAWIGTVFEMAAEERGLPFDVLKVGNELRAVKADILSKTVKTA